MDHRKRRYLRGTAVVAAAWPILPDRHRRLQPCRNSNWLGSTCSIPAPSQDFVFPLLRRGTRCSRGGCGLFGPPVDEVHQLLRSILQQRRQWVASAAQPHGRRGHRQSDAPQTRIRRHEVAGLIQAARQPIPPHNKGLERAKVVLLEWAVLGPESFAQFPGSISLIERRLGVELPAELHASLQHRLQRVHTVFCDNKLHSIGRGDNRAGRTAEGEQGIP
mmetsp:Transcript_51775/g.168292  ORF Transcript_51775/g.168292 Transcript_51775/m.168292 type:complete len:219 (-) Transcript_51775:1293-1949(-)